LPITTTYRTVNHTADERLPIAFTLEEERGGLGEEGAGRRRRRRRRREERCWLI